jgi:hypothetical protein
MFLLLVMGALQYPFATASFGVEKLSNASFGRRWYIGDVAFHSREQAKFYGRIQALCQGRAVINLTTDVLIARVCRQNPVIVEDQLAESHLAMSARQPALLARLGARLLHPNEILFTYEELSGSALERIAVVRNRRQDFHSFDINVYVAPDPKTNQ